MTVVYVAAAIAAALIVSTAVAIPVEKALHRAAHRDHYLGTLRCPRWCQHERARAAMPYGDPY